MTVAPLVIACGALASELRAVLKAQGLAGAVEVTTCRPTCTTAPSASCPSSSRCSTRPRRSTAPCSWPTPTAAPAAPSTPSSSAIPGVTRLPGSHCYEFFSGAEQFAAMHEEELGTLFLTDFLAKHFEPLLWQGLGLDRHPELRDMYFGNYRRVVLISQTDDPTSSSSVARPPQRLGLEFEHRHVGLEPFTGAVAEAVAVLADTAGGLMARPGRSRLASWS